MKIKSNQVDFKNKKFKLGKTVPKSNQTKLTVKSKKLYIPIQNSITSNDITTYKEILDKISKQLNHYNTSAKVSAFEECKIFITTSPDPNQHIAILLPVALEILYDDDRECRSALISFVSAAMKKCQTSAFISVTAIMVTFLCSGLTSLHKGIRRDALMLTEVIATTHPTLLSPYIDKLLGYMLTLLSDSSFNTGPQSFLTLSTKVNSNSSNQSSNRNSNKSSSTLSSILNILSILLSTNQQEMLSIPISFTSSPSTFSQFLSSSWRNQTSTKELLSTPTLWRLDLPHFESSVPSTILLSGIYPIPQQNLQRNTTTLSQSTLNDSSPTFHNSVEQLIIILNKVWNDITIEESILSLENIGILQTILKLFHNITTFTNREILETSNNSYCTMSETIMKHFPYQCKEAMIGIPNTKQTILSTNAIHGFNIFICDLILSSTHKDNSHVIIESTYRIMNTDMESMLNNNNNENINYKYENIDIGIDVASEYISHSFNQLIESLKQDMISSYRNTFLNDDSYNEEIISKIFHCIDNMITPLISRLDNHSSLDTIIMKDGWIPLRNIFELYHKLFSIIPWITEYKEQFINQRITYSNRVKHTMKLAIQNFCHTISFDSLWSHLTIQTVHGNQSTNNPMQGIYDNIISILSLLCNMFIPYYVISSHDSLLLSSLNESQSMWLYLSHHYEEIVYETIIFILQRMNKEYILSYTCNIIPFISIQKLCSMTLDTKWFNEHSFSIQSNHNSMQSKSLMKSIACEYLLIDIFYYGVYENIFEIAKNRMEYLIRREDSSLLTYFLDIIFQRKEELQTSKFMNIIIHGIDYSISIVMATFSSNNSRTTILSQLLLANESSQSNSLTLFSIWTFMKLCNKYISMLIDIETESEILNVILSYILHTVSNITKSKSKIINEKEGEDQEDHISNMIIISICTILFEGLLSNHIVIPSILLSIDLNVHSNQIRSNTESSGQITLITDVFKLLSQWFTENISVVSQIILDDKSYNQEKDQLFYSMISKESVVRKLREPMTVLLSYRVIINRLSKDMIESNLDSNKTYPFYSYYLDHIIVLLKSYSSNLSSSIDSEIYSNIEKIVFKNHRLLIGLCDVIEDRLFIPTMNIPNILFSIHQILSISEEVCNRLISLISSSLFHTFLDQSMTDNNVENGTESFYIDRINNYERMISEIRLTMIKIKQVFSISS